jgi:adenine phosphoribosyltransferase
MNRSEILALIETYPDFPTEGISFKDISPILADPTALASVVDELAAEIADLSFETIVGIDARGFIFGPLLAYKMKKRFVMCRKKGKLPGETVTYAYEYEYSSAELSIQKSAIPEGSRVLIVDDVLATGNTALACGKMIEQLKSTVVGYLFFAEIAALKESRTIESQIGTDTPLITLFSL